MYTRDDGTLLKNALNFIQILIEEVKIGSLRNFLGFKENDILILSFRSYDSKIRILAVDGIFS